MIVVETNQAGKRKLMWLKLEHLVLSLADEISMVGYKKFHGMN